MPSPMIRAADVLARRLYEAGCRHAFGMPGGEVLTAGRCAGGCGHPLCPCQARKCRRLHGRRRLHHRDRRARHPGGDGGAGGAERRQRGRQCRSGPVPLIVLTGCVDADEALTYTHQVLDQQAVFRPITKATFCADRRCGACHRRQGRGDRHRRPRRARCTSTCRSAWPTRRSRQQAPAAARLPARLPRPARIWPAARDWLASARAPGDDRRASMR